MNNRISTGMMFSQSVATMLAKQARLAHLEQQLATGKRLVTAKDDPVAAGTAVGLDRAAAELERFGRNADNVQNRLGLQENSLAQAGDMMARANELAIQANNASLSADDRKAVSAELQSIRDGLLSLANATDGAGRYLFAGAADATAPFPESGGTVAYSGDQTQRRVEVAPETYVADALPGSEIFMRIRTGDGSVDAHAAAANTGTGLLTDFGREASSGSWNGGSYQVRFTAADAYEIVDGGGSVVSTGSFAAGEDIVFNGLRMHVEGQPAAGDAFDIGAASSRDVFSTLQGLIDTLQTDSVTPVETAARQNALQSAMRDLSRASERMIDARASGGAQLAGLDNAAELREASSVTLQTTLSSLRDLDYAGAIGQYKLESAALQAAQTLFSQMQAMSLFNTIR